MRKEVLLVFYLIFASLFLISLAVSVFAESNNSENQSDINQTNGNQSCVEEWSCDKWSDCVDSEKTRTCTDSNACGTEDSKPKTSTKCNMKDDNKTSQGIGQDLSEQIRERRREFREGNYTMNQGQFLNVKMLSQELREMRAGNISAKTKLNITAEEDDNNKTKLKVKLANGKDVEIKIMPNIAAANALERLRLKNCNESNNCSIELKEVGKGENMKPSYEVQIERHSRILALFRAKMQVQTQVDAENGEIIKVKKPWWAFLASEPEE